MNAKQSSQNQPPVNNDQDSQNNVSSKSETPQNNTQQISNCTLYLSFENAVRIYMLNISDIYGRVI